LDGAGHISSDSAQQSPDAEEVSMLVDVAGRERVEGGLDQVGLARSEQCRPVTEQDPLT